MVADRRWGLSIRLRITAVATGIVTVALVVAGAALLATLRHQVLADTDAALLARLDELVTLARQPDLPAVLPSRGEDSNVVQIIEPPGRIRTRSADLLPGRLLTPRVPPAGQTLLLTVAHAPVPDAAPFRVAARTVDGPGPVVVVAATSLEAARQALAAVRTGLAVGVPALVLLVCAITWLGLGRALGPIERMRRAVGEISLSALDQRVPEPRVRDEIGRLATTMNDMLARLEAASTRQRAFVADASHELRSPLASVQTQLDVARAHPDETDWAALAEQLSADTLRIQRIVEDLLFLAAGDERAVRPQSRPVDLDELVLRAVEPLRTRGRVEIGLAGVEGGRVSGDASQLNRLVVNLLDNAERHACSRVDVSLRRCGGDVELAVTDDGPGIPPEARERVFERFARLDEARSRDAGGAGLGLAIARGIALAHGGTIVVADSARGARFEVHLPAAGG